MPLCQCCRRSRNKKELNTSSRSYKSAPDQTLNLHSGTMSLVHHVQDKDDFDNQLKEAGVKLVVVDFYATWCGPCKMISPKLEEMAQQYTDVIFLKVDVDDCEEVATIYNISCMPTFILIKKSEQVEVFSGANADKLRELIVSHK